jgi:hypothetical protein
MTAINQLSYKEVFQLAQSKGYGSVIVCMAKYGGSATLPYVVTNGASELCELTLIQKWLRDEHKIYFEIDAQLIGGIITYRACHSRLIVGMVRRITTFKNSSYETALLHSINEALKLI